MKSAAPAARDAHGEVPDRAGARSPHGLREAGKLGEVKIVGFDAGPKQVEDLKEGVVQALIAQQPAEIGKLGVQQAVAAIKGETTKPEIGTGFTTITKDNLDENQDAPYKSSC